LPVTQYKKVEKEFADRMGSWFRRIWVSIGNFFKYVMVKGKQRFTVMLIPHSEKKIFNFQISFFTLIFVTCTLSIILVGFFVLATHFTAINEQNTQLIQDKDANEKTLTSLKDQIASIRTAGSHFKSSMDDIMNAVQSLATTTSQASPVIGASYSSFPETVSPAADGIRELSDLRTVTSVLESSQTNLESISHTIEALKDLMANTPTTWPLKGAIGTVTTRFGWTTNPFTKVGYSHNGLDIAAPFGTPIVATADGNIAEIGNNADLGNFVVIKHKYGFYTRYAHMSRTAGKGPGSAVKRGDIIGFIGLTGLTTGPHLHYEVRLGSQYYDPMGFLSIPPGNQ
jgi:murein DD-endopeptidase MepM/ murein hydrolase activator NlpD